MRRSRLMQLASAVTVAALGAAFAAPAGAQADRGNKDGTLVIAHLGPETGDLSAIIDSLRIPVQIAVDEINAAGGVNDTPVTLVTGDDGTDPEVASQTLDRLLTSDKADVIIGPASSATALGIIDKIGSGAALTCSGSNTSADLSTKKVLKTGKGYYRRTAPPDKFQGPALAELVLSDGYSNVGILVRNDSYGVGFGKAIQKSLKQGGAKIAGNVAYSTDEGASYDSDVQKVLDKNPDAVIVIGFNDDGAKVLQSLIGQGAGPGDLPLYTADGMQSSSLGEAVDPANPGVVQGMKGTAPAAAPAGIDSPFIETFAATGTDAIFSSYYYDCTIISALAAVKAKSDDPAKIKAAWNSIVQGRERCNTFADCKELLEAGETIHYLGASQEYDHFGKTEPTEGVYQPWAYDAEAKAVDDDPSTQIDIG